MKTTIIVPTAGVYNIRYLEDIYMAKRRKNLPFVKKNGKLQFKYPTVSAMLFLSCKDVLELNNAEFFVEKINI